MKPLPKKSTDTSSELYKKTLSDSANFDAPNYMVALNDGGKKTTTGKASYNASETKEQSVETVTNAQQYGGYTPFTTSKAYTDAMNYTNGLLKQLSSGRTSYTDQIKDLMAQIQGREDFSYDVSQDTLFQQSLASAMASGKTAMQDTIGQASALTGGYGSTYATSAGNQAYNGYIQDAYANLPEYYQMALDAYEAEGQRMYDQLGMLTNADATEYQRMYDAWNANYNNAQNMYAQEYGQYQDDIANSMNMAQLQMQREAHDADLDYQQRQLQMAEEAHKADMEYQQWQEALAMEEANTPWDFSEVTSTLYDKWKREGIDSAIAYFDSLNVPEGHEFGDAVVAFMEKNIGYADPEGTTWNRGGYDEESVPLRLRTFEVTDVSLTGKVKEVKDNFGYTYDIDDLPPDIANALMGREVGDKYKAK